MPFTLSDLLDPNASKRSSGESMPFSLGEVASSASDLLSSPPGSTPYEFGGQVTDKTGSPELGYLANLLALNSAQPGGGGVGRAAIAYHGSPHLFDAFKMEKVGTGEGAQAYGHGLYFAENPAVAATYAERAPYLGRHTQQLAQEALNEAGGDMELGKQILQKRYQSNTDQYLRQPLADALNNFKELVKPSTKGLYKVDIPDEAISKMLDWDKPVMDLPFETRQLLKKAGAKIADYAPNTQTVGDVLPRTAAASAILREAGIPGIKYLDQGSRAGGKGTYNYVVFDENLPKIKGRE